MNISGHDREHFAFKAHNGCQTHTQPHFFGRLSLIHSSGLLKFVEMRTILAGGSMRARGRQNSCKQNPKCHMKPEIPKSVMCTVFLILCNPFICSGILKVSSSVPLNWFGQRYSGYEQIWLYVYPLKKNCIMTNNVQFLKHYFPVQLVKQHLVTRNNVTMWSIPKGCSNQWV